MLVSDTIRQTGGHFRHYPCELCLVVTLGSFPFHIDFNIATVRVAFLILDTDPSPSLHMLNHGFPST